MRGRDATRVRENGRSREVHGLDCYDKEGRKLEDLNW